LIYRFAIAADKRHLSPINHLIRIKFSPSDDFQVFGLKNAIRWDVGMHQPCNMNVTRPFLNRSH